ncbi:MAG: DUF5658 family protein [Armatimonadetes bacterium]|nr:DUF5658 family protein [Armatimonadota bacterium]
MTRGKAGAMKYKISIESLILIAICVADMLVTLYCVAIGIAKEQNPIMATCINHSPWMFVLIKLLSFVPFVIAIEWYRKKNPSFALKACRSAIALYVAAYVGLTLGVNI